MSLLFTQRKWPLYQLAVEPPQKINSDNKKYLQFDLSLLKKNDSDNKKYLQVNLCGRGMERRAAVSPGVRMDVAAVAPICYAGIVNRHSTRTVGV